MKVTSGIMAVNTAGDVANLEELTKLELDRVLRKVAEEDGPDMLIHHIWPIVKALEKANKVLGE